MLLLLRLLLYLMIVVFVFCITACRATKRWLPTTSMSLPSPVRIMALSLTSWSLAKSSKKYDTQPAEVLCVYWCVDVLTCWPHHPWGPDLMWCMTCILCNLPQVLKKRLTELKPEMPSRREHKLTHYQECKNVRDKKACYEMVSSTCSWYCCLLTNDMYVCGWGANFLRL